MIFIILGSQKFQFNRLLAEIDKLIFDGEIKERVMAQIGYSDYLPQKFDYKRFMDKSEFLNIINKADIVISHGGTGSIINSLLQKKYVIAIPRDSKFGEHVDNHQYEIVSQFEKSGYIKGVYNIKDISTAINDKKNFKVKKYESNTKKIVECIEELIIKKSL